MSFFPKPGCWFARHRALGRYGDPRRFFNIEGESPLPHRGRGRGPARSAGRVRGRCKRASSSGVPSPGARGARATLSRDAGEGFIPALLGLVLLFATLLFPSAAAQAGTRVLAFGDSLTAGYGLMPDQAFPVRLQARLKAAGTAVEITNAGVSGDTSAGGLARLDWALAEHPDVVLVELGANDALRGIDPKLTYANLDKILARVKASGAKVLLLGMLAPPNWGRDYEKEFDAIYPALARKYDVPLYPFFLDGVATLPDLNQEDGIHPNKQGVEIIVGRVAPYVQRLLGGKGAQG
jgi:acyl-CoA thioesterase-1